MFAILEPGDATRYTVYYDIVRRTPNGNGPPLLFFAFGVGDVAGGFLVMPLGKPRIHVDFGYFISKVGDRMTDNEHGQHVAHTVFCHVYGTEPWETDIWPRIAEFKEGWLDELPTANDLMW